MGCVVKLVVVVVCDGSLDFVLEGGFLLVVLFDDDDSLVQQHLVVRTTPWFGLRFRFGLLTFTLSLLTLSLWSLGRRFFFLGLLALASLSLCFSLLRLWLSRRVQLGRGFLADDAC